jgi:LCP family protein required for cell wall assembly
MGTDAAHASDQVVADRPVGEPGPALPSPRPRARRPRHARPRSALRRALIALGALTLVLTALLAGGFFLLENRYVGNINRVDHVFAGLNNRPAPATPNHQEAAQPVTFLLMGSDTRAHPTAGNLPSGRSDAIMIVRFSGDRQHAQVISIPRDSWVNVPGYGMHKINASYAYGGPSLLIQTVEQVTGVRIDHFAAIDFDGIAAITDDLGGVDVMVAQTTTNGPYTFQAGLNHITGDQARWYLGQRHRLAGGDFDREKRDQQYLRSMFQKLFSAQTFTDPSRLDAALRAVTGSISMDDGLSDTTLLSLGLSMRDLRPADVQYFTAPVLGTGREGAASVVYLDQTKGARMWGYLRTDSLSQNAQEFSSQLLPDVPN